jgi:CHASE3 domain sensor protein
MSLKPKDLRELRRYLRAASDNIEDTADLIVTDDRDQTQRLRAIVKELQGEIAEIDKKISAAERNGGAK